MPLISEFTGPPVRLKLSRLPGFKLQVLSIATNGRKAVNCARPGRFGNPFHHNNDGTRMVPKLAGQLFRAQLLGDGWFVNDQGRTIRLAEIRERLAGKNLACFCPLTSDWCHCQPLLEVANGN